MVETSFVTEYGMIIDEHGDVILEVPGHQAHVTFPEETIWKIHQRRPGFIHRMAHTHPIGMMALSTMDRAMLKNWAIALHPFPARLSTLTYKQNQFIETIYTMNLEPRETWSARMKVEQQSTPRQFIERPPLKINLSLIGVKQPQWVKRIKQKSFEEN